MVKNTNLVVRKKLNYKIENKSNKQKTSSLFIKNN